jgi:hypothetical protein
MDIFHDCLYLNEKMDSDESEQEVCRDTYVVIPFEAGLAREWCRVQ